MMDWFNAMVQSQAEFEKIFNQKTSYDCQKESTFKHEAQIPVNNRIEELVLYVNSVIIFNSGDKTWEELYKNINGIIKQATTAARARRSGNNNKDTEEDN